MSKYGGRQEGKINYRTEASGLALKTVKEHDQAEDIRLFGSNFCPFVQRVWISLEAKGLPYQYREVDPYDKPEELMRLNPRGLVPALEHQGEAIPESTVILDFLEDLAAGPLAPKSGQLYRPLLPTLDKPHQRAHARLWADHVNRRIVPQFYKILQMDQGREEYLKALQELTQSMSDGTKGFWDGKELGWVDIMFAPWVVREKIVLGHYRKFQLPDEPWSKRYEAFCRAILEHPAIKATTSDDSLYVDSYARYAENRENLSQVGKATNTGSHLP